MVPESYENVRYGLRTIKYDLPSIRIWGRDGVIICAVQGRCQVVDSTVLPLGNSPAPEAYWSFLRVIIDLTSTGI
jgi:hypothetical protein